MKNDLTLVAFRSPTHRSIADRSHTIACVYSLSACYVGGTIARCSFRSPLNFRDYQLPLEPP
jgi:hypothetical protein